MVAYNCDGECEEARRKDAGAGVRRVNRGPVAKQQRAGASSSNWAASSTKTTSTPTSTVSSDHRQACKMGFLGRLYKAETLDTRFVARTGQKLPDAQPSKWNTPEYYFYYLCFLTIPFFMVKSVYDVSGPWHASYKHYEGLLEPGWIPGRKVDNSDAQYRSFRDNIPYMALVVVLHPLLRRAYEGLKGAPVTKLDSSIATEARKESRIRFDVGFAAIFLLALHGVSALKVLTILYINYKVATAIPPRYVPAATWVFNITILFANELCNGYKFSDAVSILLPPQTTAAGTETKNWGDWVDSYGGLIPRWEILFNICVLRLISFNFDYYWSLDRRAASPVEVSWTPTCSNHIQNRS